MKSGRRRFALWACTWAAGAALGGVAVHVSPTGDDAAAGTAEAPKKTIQAVFNAWKPGMELVLLPGTYHLQEIKLAGENGALHLNGSGTIRGATGNPADVVIDGGGATECIRLAGNLNVCGLTFQNGGKTANANVRGVNLSVQMETVVVSNCMVRSATPGVDRPATGLFPGAKIYDCRFLGVTGTVEGAVLDLSGSNWVENCTFDACVVTNGSLGAGPGAVRARSGTTLRGCAFTRMAGLALKATCAAEAPARIVGCTFAENAGANGGACWADDDVVLSGCVLTGNTASGSGGAVYARGASLTNCVFEGNAAGRFGGALAGVLSEGGKPTRVVDSRFVGNVAGWCGGAVSSGCRDAPDAPLSGNVLLAECLISNNQARADAASEAYFGGGGVFFLGKSYQAASGGEIVRCQVVDNRSGKTGGGVCVRNWASSPGFTGSRPILVRNSLIARNAGGDVGGGLYLIHNGADGAYVLDSCTVAANTTPRGPDSGYGLYHKLGGVFCTNTLFALNTLVTDTPQNYAYCCFDPAQGAAGSGAQGMGDAVASMTAEAGLADPEQGDYRLASPRSPCCNAGLAEAWMVDAVDLDGKARLFSSAPDIGCYELSWPQASLILFR